MDAELGCAEAAAARVASIGKDHLATEADRVDCAPTRVAHSTHVAARLRVVADRSAIARPGYRQGKLALQRHAAHGGVVASQAMRQLKRCA